jgi:hypothetical protein
MNYSRTGPGFAKLGCGGSYSSIAGGYYGLK